MAIGRVALRKLMGNCKLQGVVLPHATGELQFCGSCLVSSYCNLQGLALRQATRLVRVLLGSKQATGGLRFGGSCSVSSSVLRCVNLLGNSNFPGPALRQAIGEYRSKSGGYTHAPQYPTISATTPHQKRKPLRVVLQWNSAHRLRNQRSTKQRSTPAGDSMQSIGNMCRSSDTVQGTSWAIAHKRKNHRREHVSSGRHCSHEHQMRQCQSTIS